MLEKHIAVQATYNSRERELEHASTCLENTHESVIEKISVWSKANNGLLICWLHGPAGSGKSTIAHTIAEQCDRDQKLAFSFFFSWGKRDRSDTTKFVPTFAYQLAAKSSLAIQTSMCRTLATIYSLSVSG
jgi:adenylylsulfate kinase-like enzyme